MTPEANLDALVDAQAIETWWHVKADTVRWWKRRGWLEAKGSDTAGRLLYRWGDVIEAEFLSRQSGRGRGRAA
jgi:hypothetical protein